MRLPYLAGKHLPERLYHKLALFRSAFGRADYGALVIKNFIQVDHEKLGPTPTRWQEVMGEKIGQYEFSTALIHGALGGTLAEFLYQRKGGLSHSLIPDPEMRGTQTGAGEVKLGLHTEDPNLRHNADFISFLWLRNNERVPCHLFSLRSFDWEDKSYAKILRESIFDRPLDGNYISRHRQQDHESSPIPVLYGNSVYPWMQFDFVEQLSADAERNQRAQQALEDFMKDVDRSTYSEFVPDSGDLCVLNNKMCAHGRGSFKQGLDPIGKKVEKRWMLRMMSVVDRFAFYETAKPEDPHFSRELP